MERDQQQDLLEQYLYDLINIQKNFEQAAQTIIEYSGYYSYEPELEMKKQQSSQGTKTIPLNNPGSSARTIPIRMPAHQNNGPVFYQQSRPNGPSIPLQRR
ncbi:unnamed protein product [Blepharisma stoltei]|uniref:Uncharacterized protein n=1 Tax=Blepharisma stoltei TaxID=1481888 RepID=A0AAU9IHX5_9CILI|nr:unnamed protein product [Blepharisma stoltei]